MLLVLVVRCPGSVGGDDCQDVLEVIACSSVPIDKGGDKVQTAIRPPRSRGGVEL